MIRKGDTVRFKSEWCDAGDEDAVFVAIEDEDGGRVKVEARVGLAINPVQIVLVEMFESESARAMDCPLSRTARERK